MTCTSCQNRIEELQARVDWLEGQLSGHEEFDIPSEWGLTVEKVQILALLLRIPMVTTSSWEVSRELRGQREIENSEGAFRCHICQLRKRLSPFGLNITANYGRGYSLENREPWRIRLSKTTGRVAA